jgi:hypothetical protein
MSTHPSRDSVEPIIFLYASFEHKAGKKKQRSSINKQAVTFFALAFFSSL